MSLRSLNQESVYATLEKTNCTLDESCDTCEAPYQRAVEVENYTARFIIGESNRKLEQENTDEEIFLIDSKNETIDVEDMLVQAVVLSEPIAKHCPDCAKKVSEMPDEEDGEYMESTGNIIFH
ncbi:TPA: hypothetical protein DEP21_02960 [Patescibacteria group bacterium]|nr:hypothetical protein [Candidatus Gracilibacteria bacterium]